MPDIDWMEVLRMVPVVAGSINPLAGVIGAQILNFAEGEINQKMADDPSLSREDVINASTADFNKGLDIARKSRQKGRENE